MTVTKSKQIEVRTTISFEDYTDMKMLLTSETAAADIFVIFSADTVMRTFAHNRYQQWFVEQDAWIDDFLGWGDIGDKMLTCVDADLVDAPIEIVWLFDLSDEKEKELAMLFKLTWGGAN